VKKLLTPILLALVGLGAGVGAGIALKPAPEPGHAAACVEPGAKDAAGHAAASAVAGAGEEHANPAAAAAAPCPPPDPFAPPAGHAEAEGGHGGGHGEELAYVTMDKPFVVPIFKGEKVVAMVVVSLSVETDSASAPTVEGMKPRLRDSFLEAMFRHANSGGFDGSFTAGTKMEDLKSALLSVAKGILPSTSLDGVLVTEIARQDV